MAKVKTKNKGMQLIKKSNQLIEARYKFDVWEMRVLLTILADIRKEDYDFKPYRVWYKKVIKSFGLKPGQSYSLLREAAKSLMGKTFRISNFEGKFRRETEYHIIRSVNYLADDEKGVPGVEQQEYVDVTFDPEMKPLLLQLQKNFTAYDLQNIKGLGAYAIRVYELLKQYEFIGERTLGIDEMKRMFELEDEYPLFANFFQKVIKPSIKAINDETDLIVTELEKKKDGRKVVELRFVFHKKKTENAKNEPPTIALEPLALPFFIENESHHALDGLRTEGGVGEEKPKEKDDAESVLFEKYYTMVGEFWGIGDKEFKKRLVGKTEEDVERAMAFTKQIIRTGTAKNPAGLFLEALSNGHQTAEQIKTGLKEDKKRLQSQKQAELKPFVETLNDLETAYKKAINNAIRTLTTHDESVTQGAITRIKSRQMAFADKTIDDFRQLPFLRELVKADIMAQSPQLFEPIHADFSQRIAAVKKQILAVDEGFRF